MLANRNTDAANAPPPTAGEVVARRDRRLHILATRRDALGYVSVQEIEAALRPLISDVDRTSAMLERQSYTPWLIAIGAAADARRWAETDRRHVDRVPDPRWERGADLVEQQLRAAEGARPSFPPRRDPTDAFASDQASWYRLQIQFYWDLIDGDAAAGRRRIEQISRHRRHVPPVLRGTPESGEALCAVVDGNDEVGPPVPEPELSLHEIGNVLIAAQAVALGGTRQAAQQWSAWFNAHWPAHLLQAPEWPVLAHRVRGLLDCRTGDLSGAMRWLAEAILVADRIGSPVESALARIQYAELMAFDPRFDSPARWRETVNAGTERCRSLRIPHEHHAYLARRAATLGRFDSMSNDRAPSSSVPTTLTAREVEVLRLFSLGNSYRQAAQTLGVEWRTVQSHAYNAYQKLGVSSKIAAVSAASHRQLL